MRFSVKILSAACLIGMAASAAPAFAQSRALLNYEEIHKPVMGQAGMVVSQSDTASQVGAQILQAGGNAIDAAVATAFALAVTLPRAGNIGGDGFMLIHLAAEQRTVAIDYRSMAPALATLDKYLDAEGKLQGNQSGILAAGVPGTVAGLAMAHKNHGKLPWRDLLKPAIALARDGFVLSHDEAFALDWGKQRLALSKPGASIFLRADGSALRAGERLVQRDLAWSLEQIAKHGADAFYRGAIADRLDAAMRKHGGLLRKQDLAAYEAKQREPLRSSYRGIDIVTMAPASGGGAGIIAALNILEAFDLKAMGAESADAIHTVAEALKLSWRDREAHARDPDFGPAPLAGLTSKAYGLERAKLISMTQARPAREVAGGDPWAHESPETTHFSVVDTQGNAVSNTYTIGADFGTGIVIEGTGFLLGNLIGNFSLPAQLSATREGRELPANAMLPGRRPISSMSPTMLMRDGKPWLITGSPGGNTIPGTVVQVITGVVDFGMNVAEATNSPRLHQRMSAGGELQVERGISPDTLKLLRDRGHTIVFDQTIGSTQSILMEGERPQGAADPRRPGASAIGQ